MNLTKRQIAILAGVGGLILLLILAIWFGRKSLVERKTLTVWGVFDTAEAYDTIFREFRRKTGIFVKYLKKDITTYESDLVNALATGQGPDVFMINNAWLPKHFDKLLPAPVSIITPAKIRELYPDVVYEDFVAGDMVWAIPLFVDTLALFYNRQLFNQAGIAFPPRTWEEVVEIIPRLKRINEKGIIEQSAIAMGTAFNINRATDILAALMLQIGTSIIDRENLVAVLHRTGGAPRSPGVEALEFYLQFSDPSKPVYTWNAEQHYSIDAFSEGTLAMMLSYAYHIPTIKAKGPFIDFGISPLPQPKERLSRNELNYANYWGFAVSRQSRNATLAWQLIEFMTNYQNARLYYQQTGRPPARRDLIEQVLDQPIVGVFARQALTARSWFRPDHTKVEEIFLSLIESVRRGDVSSQAAVIRAAEQIDLLLSKYTQGR